MNPPSLKNPGLENADGVGVPPPKDPPPNPPKFSASETEVLPPVKLEKGSENDSVSVTKLVAAVSLEDAKVSLKS
jgi:hypothetical protein